MWYYESETGQRGPADDADVRRLIGEGQIRPTTRLWREGQREWLPAAQTELAGLFQAPQAMQAYAQPGSVVPAGYAATGYPALQPQFVPAFGQTGVFFAGFWIRVAAQLLDAIFIYAGLFVLLIPFILVVGVTAALDTRNGTNSSGLAIAYVALLYLWPLCYYIGFTMSRMQGTPGKRIVGIYVVRESGRRVGFWFALGRQFAFILSALPLYIGFMMAGWTSQKRALHDMVCSSRVVYGRPPR